MHRLADIGSLLMILDDKDDRFSGAKRESYFSSRRELNKHEVTGEAVEMIREFIFKNLIAPTYREMKKSKENRGIYEHQGLGKQNN
jgi:hypothetical protein